MRVYVDTNIWLDLLLNRTSKYLSYQEIAQQIFARSTSCEFYTCISDLTVSEIKKKIPEKIITNIFTELGKKLIILEITKEDVNSKYDIHKPDNAHIACAIRNECQAIISNDLEFQSIKEIKVYRSPSF